MEFALPPILPLRVTFRTAEPQRLPPFLGSALHGALGRALYRTVCAFPRRDQCFGCPLYARCAYPALFETPAAANDALHAAGIRDQAPRPLVVAPEPGWTRASGNPFRLKPDDDVPVRLTLIGRAIDDLPVVTVALQTLARRGLGIPEEGAAPDSSRRRAGLQLASVVTADGAHVVYDGPRDTFTSPPLPPRSGECPPESIVVQLVTPLRLKHNGQLLSTVPPDVFLAALARRADALSVLHGNGQPAVDEGVVAELASGIEVKEAALRRVHVTRYSAREARRMQWPGLMGTLRWHGHALGELWPLLRFGESVQLGKGTALGFGRYALREASRGGASGRE